MEVRELRAIGLTKNEAVVLSLLMKIAPTTPSELIKKSGIHRNTIYDNLKKLENKNLIYSVFKNKRYFYIANLEMLKQILAHEEKRFLVKKEIFKKLINETKKIESYQPGTINILSGIRGIKALAEDLLEEGKNYLVWGAPKIILEILPKYYWKNFALKRKERKIKTKQIISDKLKKWVDKELDKKYNNVRYFSKIFDSTKSEIVIYGDKIAIIVLAPEPNTIIIKDKNLAESYKNTFKILWKNAKIKP